MVGQFLPDERALHDWNQQPAKLTNEKGMESMKHALLALNDAVQTSSLLPGNLLPARKKESLFLFPGSSNRSLLKYQHNLVLELGRFTSI